MPLGTKNMPPLKNLSRCSLSNLCDADADADADMDISKTTCRPLHYGGLHNKTNIRQDKTRHLFLKLRTWVEKKQNFNETKTTK